MNMGLLMSPGAETTSVIRAFVQHCSERLQSGSFPGLGT